MTMIERMLPPAVVAVEALRDDEPTLLLGEEQAVMARAVARRRREFAAGRVCARRALARLGIAPLPLLPGPRGDPQWPLGIVGSITHCDGYCACAVARRADLAALGIDAERHRPLPTGLVHEIAVAEELAMVRRLTTRRPEVAWDRLLFSAKEAVYKAWSPSAGGYLDFTDARVDIDPGHGTFSARVLDGASATCRPVARYAGRWLVVQGLILTAATVEARACEGW